ncbi:MAG: radical SAM protein [Candidatus Omnitrophica bacterium]|nr:radical SAM protein [Candidatus Omnitrophota bacterium]MBD3269107.1 radical SAM protein [Candidatus Omnitrophota bacterium]
MNKFYIYNVFPNCPLISMDCQRISDYLTANGFSFTSCFQKADIILITFCSITDAMEKKSLNELRYHLKRVSPLKAVIMLECAQGINKNLTDEESGYLPRITTEDTSALDEILKPVRPFSSIPEPNKIKIFSSSLLPIAANKIITGIKDLSLMGMFRRFLENKRTIKDRFLSEKVYHIRISAGCYGKCAFCVRSACPPFHKSRPLDEIKKEFRRGLEEGYDLFMFVAHDTGSYGIDSGLSIDNLLGEIFKIEGNYKLILVDFGVEWLIKYFRELKPLFLKNHEKIQRLALAVQSGSDKVLQSMERSYRRDEVIDCLLQLKSSLPGYKDKVSIQIMVGFPGEENHDFEKTLDLVRKAGLPIVNIFGFSPRPQTKAYSMRPRIEKTVMRERINKLLEVRDSFR